MTPRTSAGGANFYFTLAAEATPEVSDTLSYSDY